MYFKENTHTLNTKTKWALGFGLLLTLGVSLIISLDSHSIENSQEASFIELMNIVTNNHEEIASLQSLTDHHIEQTEASINALKRFSDDSDSITELGSAKFKELSSEIMTSASVVNQNVDWTSKVDQYFATDPHKLNDAFRECKDYIQRYKNHMSSH